MSSSNDTYEPAVYFCYRLRNPAGKGLSKKEADCEAAVTLHDSSIRVGKTYECEGGTLTVKTYGTERRFAGTAQLIVTDPRTFRHTSLPTFGQSAYNEYGFAREVVLRDPDATGSKTTQSNFSVVDETSTQAPTETYNPSGATTEGDRGTENEDFESIRRAFPPGTAGEPNLLEL
jgi:hypothetical protein